MVIKIISKRFDCYTSMSNSILSIGLIRDNKIRTFDKNKKFLKCALPLHALISNACNNTFYDYESRFFVINSIKYWLLILWLSRKVLLCCVIPAHFYRNVFFHYISLFSEVIFSAWSIHLDDLKFLFVRIFYFQYVNWQNAKTKFKGAINLLPNVNCQVKCGNLYFNF